MRRLLPGLILVLLVIIGLAHPLRAENPFELLKEGEKIGAFRVANLYDNATDKALGARFISERYDFVIDLFQIQTVPQAFFWVKTVPYWDKGEPHTLEHLVLGKGNRGRYVAALEDMYLASSTAFTSQLRTCYSFNTIAGDQAFYIRFEEGLRALTQPDFTDEEIRREVCHIGITEDTKTGQLALDEKGTVYTEMVSAFEKPWYYHYRVADELIYGPDHPVVNISGGDPAAIRTMVPDDIRQFHRRNYHLSNMGVIVAIPDNIPIRSFLENMSGILTRCQEQPDSSNLIGIGKFDFPAPQLTVPTGTIKIVDYPGNPDQDPGHILVFWPADLEYESREGLLANLFLETFAGGTTSNLYDLFINSRTRRLDIGGNSIFGSASSDPGHPIYFGLSGVNSSAVNEIMLDSVRSLILKELHRVYEFADNSDSLRVYNARVLSRLITSRRNTENYLNTPPMFGLRGAPSGGWLGQLEEVEKQPGFRKSLIRKKDFAFADSLLATGINFWREYIDRWKLLSVPPLVVGGTPSPDILANESEKKTKRIAEYVGEFKKKYGVRDEQQAIGRYKEEFDRNTAELEKLAAQVQFPEFVADPPLTLDDQLRYEIIKLPGEVPLVASTFENMTSATVSLYMRLDVIPESLLVYVPILPPVLTEIGVVHDGIPIPYQNMKESLRKEILRLDAGFSVNHLTGRAELSLTGAGSNQEELNKALEWIDLALYSPYLSVENTGRLIDLLDQGLVSLRNAMKGSEENWVDYPYMAYRFQTNPLLMTADCFLTKAHHYQRLRWRLTDPGNDSEQKELSIFLDNLAAWGNGKTRDQLASLALVMEPAPTDTLNLPLVAELRSLLAGFSEKSHTTCGAIIKNLLMTIPDIPDASLANDWQYLCRETKADLLFRPEQAIADLQYLLRSLRRTDNTRLSMVSNSADRVATFDKIKAIVGKLDSETKSIRQNYAADRRIVNRLRDREPNLTDPLYVGLINPNSRNGVISASARLGAVYDTSTQAVLDGLTVRLLTGRGPHSLFMKTWGAGLAYSNGYSFGDRSGRIAYYAERCPDISETIRFVADQLKLTEKNPNLIDYAVAQAFQGTRASSAYEGRASGIAADLADGFTPDIVRQYRQKILSLRKDKDLADRMYSRIEPVFGAALPGYGPTQDQCNDAYCFVIGPETQFQFLEKYLKSTEGDPMVYRLYPRDFWLTM